MKLTPETITAEALGGSPITDVKVSLPRFAGYRVLEVVMRSEKYGEFVQLIEVYPHLLEDDKASEIIRDIATDALRYAEKKRDEESA